MTGAEDVTRIVRSTWLEVLETTDADPASDFFRAGGTSLLAMLLVGQLQHQLELDLPVAVLFEHRTLGGFTEEVRSRSAAGWDSAVMP
jgi:Phosphopantetheine attachment site